MKTAAHDLHVLLVGFLRHIGPDTRAFHFDVHPSHDSLSVRVTSDAAVEALAVWWGLNPITREHVGALSWTQANGEEGKLHVTVTGPHTTAAPSDPDGKMGGTP